MPYKLSDFMMMDKFIQIRCSLFVAKQDILTIGKFFNYSPELIEIAKFNEKYIYGYEISSKFRLNTECLWVGGFLCDLAFRLTTMQAK